MRVVAIPSITNVVYCGIAIKAGTRDELPHESGMAISVSISPLRERTTEVRVRLSTTWSRLAAI